MKQLNKLSSADNIMLLAVEEIGQPLLGLPLQFPLYTVLFIQEGSGSFYADIGKFQFTGPVLLFSTPFQQLTIMEDQPLKGFVFQFHSDFYCIEYHKKEVACNGLLFNNIYIEPSIALDAEHAPFFSSLFTDIMTEFAATNPNEHVLRSYLQLFLAKSSSIKLRAMADPIVVNKQDKRMETFIQLLESHYLTLHKPADYAQLLGMPPNTLTKRCQRYFGKSPSLMIQERLILEAKKRLHLTHQSIKEIAFSLNFSDEFYFSRFFKKFTRVSPQAFRDKAGISIMADQAK